LGTFAKQTGLLILLLSTVTAPTWTKPLPEIRQQDQLNQETRFWIQSIEAVKASGQSVSLHNDGTKEAKAALQDRLGPFFPIKRLQYLWIAQDGTFGFKLKKKYKVDIPLKAGGYIRANVGDGEVVGKLKATHTVKKNIPVKLLVFRRKNSVQIDKLDAARDSTVPDLGKLFGMLPHIVCLAYLEHDGLPYAAPQLDGKGASENTQSVTDLLYVEDSLPRIDWLRDGKKKGNDSAASDNK